MSESLPKFLLSLLAVVGLATRPARAEVTADQVRRALAMGVRYLKSKQNKVDGSWTRHPGQPGGVTSLCTLALLEAGEPVTVKPEGVAADSLGASSAGPMMFPIAGLSYENWLN